MCTATELLLYTEKVKAGYIPNKSRRSFENEFRMTLFLFICNFYILRFFYIMKYFNKMFLVEKLQKKLVA